MSEHEICVAPGFGFAKRWLESRSVQFEMREADPFSHNFLDQISNAKAFLWAMDHNSTEDLLYADGIMGAASKMGVLVFPNQATRFGFDNKISQSKMLQAAGIPQPKTWVFFKKTQAVKFAKSANYPLVFKLKRGAASENVSKLANASQARELINKMFGRGLKAHTPANIVGVIKRRSSAPNKDPILVRTQRTLPKIFEKLFRSQREQGYVLFQEFIPNQTYDTRITVIGNRAFTYTRSVRPNDFRSSGSGLINHLTPDQIDKELLVFAFDAAARLGSNCAAFDIVRKPDGQPVILEFCYLFRSDFIQDCSGFFDATLNWHEGSFFPEDLILEDVINEITR